MLLCNTGLSCGAGLTQSLEALCESGLVVVAFLVASHHTYGAAGWSVCGQPSVDIHLNGQL